MTKIEVKIGAKVIMKSDSIMLEPYAPNTTRRFIFKDIRWLKNAEDYRYHKELTVLVYYFKKSGKLEYFTEFNMYVFESQGFKESEWHVLGFVRHGEYDREYRQGMTDIFKTWQDNGNINWFSLPINDHLKKDYFFTCMFYAGISDNIIKRDVYEIDMSLVKEEQDFLYLASLAFTGDRGYVGYDLYTFDDCLLTYFHNRGSYFNDVKIIFANTNLLSQNMLPLYNKIKDIFLKFKFEVTEV